MLAWISAHQDLVMAIIGLFGAGGVGAIFVQWLLQRGGSTEESPVSKSGAPTIHTSATGDGMAATHTGSGSINMIKNAAVSYETLEAWRARLALSRVGASRLLDVFSRAGIAPDRAAELGRKFDSSRSLLSSPSCKALRDALEGDRLDTATEVLRSLSSAHQTD